MTERLMMIHNHIRDKEDSEFIELFPFMNRKERVKYEKSNFQSGYKFPLTEGNITIHVSPKVYSKPEDIESIILNNFVEEGQSNLILNLQDDWDTELLEHEYDHIIITARKWQETIDETIELIKRLHPNTKVSLCYKEITILDSNADIVVVPFKENKIISITSDIKPPKEFVEFEDNKFEVLNFYRSLDESKNHYKI